MAALVTRILDELLAFGHARAATLVAGAFSDALALATSLRDGAKTADLQAKLSTVRGQIAAADPAAAPIVAAVTPHANAASVALGKLAGELAGGIASLDAAVRAAADLAQIAAELDAAIAVIARAVGHMDDANPAARLPDVEAAILAIDEPWIAPLRALPGGVGANFDAFAKQMLGIGGATGQLGSHLVRDRAKSELAFALTAGGERAPVAAVPAFTLDAVTLTAFLDYGATTNLGIRVAAIIRTGLRNDALLEMVVPASAPPADTTQSIVQIDTSNGLTLGSGKSPRLMLPFHFDLAGIDVRDVALAVAPDAPGGAELELTTTLSGKLGGVIGLVIEGGGVIIGIDPSAPGGFPLSIALRPPDAAGLSIDAGIVRGGGFVYHKGNEYGGVLDLKLAAVGVTAIGFIGTDPFSLVLVIGVHFFPVIELSFGFTLNGVGGILALERRVDSDVLRRAIVGHADDSILFPDDPVARAPTILQTLHDVFPYEKGAFVVGPIAELGWGSQARLVTAKLGIVISLPDPKLILLGSARVAVPNVDTPRELCIVNFNAELYGEITTEHVLLVVGLTDSKVGQITVNGDLGFLVRWGGSPEMAITAGGFHPHYAAPAELTGLRRISIDMSPALFVKLHAEGYFAVTSNTLQFGALVRLTADIGAASGEAWLGLDALFRWAPRTYFEVDVRAGIALKVLGETFAGIDFSGHLEGMTPWKIQGTATLDVWFLPTVHFDIGPITWGSENPEVVQPVSPLQIVVDALQPADAWRPQLPVGADMLVRLVDDPATPLLVHPLGALEVKQIKVPLETPVEHIGRSPVTAHRVNFANPLVGAVAAGAVSHATELFAAAEYLTLTDDQRLSRASFEPFPAGIRLAATSGPAAGPGVDTVYQWDTIFPQEEGLARKLYAQAFAGIEAAVLRAGPVATAARARANPYAGPGAPVELAQPAQMEVRRKDDLGVAAGAGGAMTTTLAAHAMQSLVTAGVARNTLQLVAVGVAA